MNFESMDEDSQPTGQQFAAGQEQAIFLSSCEILNRAWEETRSIPNDNDNTYFRWSEYEGVPFIAFPSFHIGDFTASDSSYEQCDIKNENKFFSDRLKDDNDQPALVHKGALYKFLDIMKRSDLETQAANLKNQHDMDINDLNSELSENQSRLAELEWYIKTVSKGNSCSSYDVFRDLGEKKDFRINRHRMNLEDFWDKIIDMVKNHQLPSDFRYQNKWINAGTAYRRLVEPLDVTYFYHLHSDRGSYLSTKNRPLRHRVLEKWLDDKNQTRIERGKRGKKARTKFASLNEDSRFWARVEEALKTLQQQVMTESLEKFEDYVWRMITDKSISAEVFLEGSRFMKWWQQYRDLRCQSQEWQSSSPLYNYMNTEGWKALRI